MKRVRDLTIMLVLASTFLSFGLDAYWALARPQHPDHALGFVEAHEASDRTVYLTRAEGDLLRLTAVVNLVTFVLFAVTTLTLKDRASAGVSVPPRAR